jgi:hypothetical protein
MIIHNQYFYLICIELNLKTQRMMSNQKNKLYILKKKKKLYLLNTAI